MDHREDNRRAEEAARKSVEMELLDLAEILAMPSGAGKRFFKRLFERCHFSRTVFDGKSTGMFYQGQQDIANGIKSQMVAAGVWANISSEV